MTHYFDRLSGERFEADDLAEAIEYLREALCEGETVGYELVNEMTGDFEWGKITG